MEQIDCNEVSRMKALIEFLKAKIYDLLKLLHRNRCFTSQQMLTAPKPIKKKCWKFWNLKKK